MLLRKVSEHFSHFIGISWRLSLCLLRPILVLKLDKHWSHSILRLGIVFALCFLKALFLDFSSPLFWAIKGILATSLSVFLKAVISVDTSAVFEKTGSISNSTLVSTIFRGVTLQNSSATSLIFIFWSDLSLVIPFFDFMFELDNTFFSKSLIPNTFATSSWTSCSWVCPCRILTNALISLMGTGREIPFPPSLSRVAMTGECNARRRLATSTLPPQGETITQSGGSCRSRSNTAFAWPGDRGPSILKVSQHLSILCQVLKFYRVNYCVTVILQQYSNITVILQCNNSDWSSQCLNETNQAFKVCGY